MILTLAIKTLVPEVRTHLDSAPTVTCEIYLNKAVKQFCRDSGAWVVSLGTTEIMPSSDNKLPVTVKVPDSDNINSPWTVPDNGYVHRIKKILLAGAEVERIDAYTPAYKYDYVTETLLIEPHYVVSNPTSLEVYAVLTLAKGAKEMPLFFFERFSEAITNFAISQMMMMPKQLWTSSSGAQWFLRQYKLRASEAGVEVARGGTSGPVNLEPRPF